MKKILIACLVLLCILIAAILIVPSFIDWNAYKAQIAERVAQATGRKVELKGDIGLSLLPSPALTVRDARLANMAGGSEQDMARLKELDVHVALGPLLGGHIQVRSIRLIDPTFVFEVLPDGRFNWDFSHAETAATLNGGAGDGLATAVSFDQVTVENGTILYRDARNNRSETLDRLDVKVAAGSFIGPFQGQGGFRLHGVPMRGEAFIGRLVDGAAVQVRTTLSLADTDATLRFAGIVTNSTAGESHAQGELRAEGADLARALQILRGKPGNPALAQTFSLRAAVEASPADAAFSNLEAQLGDTRATGAADLRPGRAADVPMRAEVTLALNRLDLDSWLDRAHGGGARRSDSGSKVAAPPVTPLVPTPGADSAAASATAAATGTAAQAGGFALPRGLDAKLDLSVDGITYNGGLVRQGRVEASLENGRLNVDRISALLPGGSDLVAAGRLAAANGQPDLDLRVEANADNLRGLLEWLKLDVHMVPADRLRRASLDARLQGRPGRLEVGGLDLRVDTSRLTGAIAYVDRGRPAFGARLDLDRLNLDAYLPPPADATDAGAASGTASPAPAAGKSADASGGKSSRGGLTPAKLLSMADANLDLTVGEMTVRGLPVRGLHLDATAAGGALTVREAKVDDIAGVKGRLDGQVVGLSPPRGAHLTFDAQADSLAGVSRVVPWPAGAPSPERIGPVKAQLRLAGDDQRMAVEATVDAAGGTLEAGGNLLTLDKTPTAELKLRVKHPELARLVALVDDGSAQRSYGPLDLYTALNGTTKTFTLADIQGIVAGISVKGRVGTDLTGARPRLDANLQTGDLDVGRLVALPAAASRSVPDVLAPKAGSSAAGAANGTAAAGAANGTAAAGAANGTSASDPSTDPAVAAAEADGSGAVSLDWLRRFDGRLALTSAALIVGDTRIDQPALHASVENGVLTLDKFDGTLYGGQIGGTGRLAAPGNQPPTAELSLTVAKAQLAQALKGGGPLGGGALSLASGTLDLDTTLKATGATRDALLRSLSGQGRLTAQNGVVSGFDLGTLRDRLTQLDRPQDLLAAIMGLQGGETAFSRMDGTFAVDHGLLRTDDLRLTSDVGEASCVGRVNLPDETMDMRIRVTIKSTPALPPMSIRLTGPLDQPTRSFDMQAVQEYFAQRAAEGILKPAVPKDPPVSAPKSGAAPDPGALLKGLIEGLKR